MAKSIRTQLVGILLGVTLPLVVLLFTALTLWNASERSFAESEVISRAQSLNTQFLAMVDESRRTLTSFQKDRSIDWADPKVAAQVLGVYADRFPFSKGLYLFSAEGTVVALGSTGTTTPPVSVQDRRWFQRALASSTFVIGEFVVSRITGISVVPIAARIKDRNGHPLVLGMTINLEWFYTRLKEQLPSGTTFTLVAPDGLVLVRYPDPGRYSGRSFPQSEVIAKAVTGQSSTGVFAGLDKVDRLYAIRPISVDRQFLGAALAGIPVESVHQGSTWVKVAAWLLVFLVVGSGALLSVVGMRRLVLDPIRRVSDQTQILAEGKFEVRLPLGDLPAELAQLVTSVNTLADYLQVRDQEIVHYRDHLEDTVRDRTKELEATQSELVRSNTDLQQFAYVASHDLQEPLRMVASFSQLLDRNYGHLLDDRGKQYIGFAVDGATRMQHLINDLLSYSRIETHAKPLVAVDPAKAVAIAQANLQAFLEERGAEVKVGELPPVLADLGQLTQVFQNLIGNGIKFNRSQHPTVTIEARLAHDLVEFEVADNGIGIGPDFGERIFVIFQRINARSEFPGTGIGLAVCKRIVEHHGGRIWYEAAEGGGTRFLFTLRVEK